MLRLFKNNLSIIISIIAILFIISCSSDEKKPVFIEDLSYLQGKKKLLIVTKVNISIDEMLDDDIKESIQEMIDKVSFDEKYRRALTKEVLRRDKKGVFQLVIEPNVVSTVESIAKRKGLSTLNYAEINGINSDIILEVENSIYISGNRDDLMARKIENVKLMGLDLNQKLVSKRYYQSSKESIFDSIFEKNNIVQNIRNFKHTMTFILFSEKFNLVSYLLKIPSKYEPNEYEFKDRSVSHETGQEPSPYSSSSGF
jgi:hypothetical protein